MQNFQIAMIATRAAQLTAGNPDTGELLSAGEELQAVQLYNYCRERKFPPAEQLARKQGQMSGQSFPAEIWQANKTMRASYEVFRAVALALDPLWEPDEAAAKPDAGAGDDEALAQIKTALKPGR